VVKEPPGTKITITATRTCVIFYMLLLDFLVRGEDFMFFFTLAAFSKIYSVLRIKTCTSNEAGDNLLMT